MSHRLLEVFSRLRYAAVVGVLVLPTLFIAIPVAIGAGETRDDAAHLTPANDSAHALAWTETVGPNTPAQSTSTHRYWFVADLGTAATAKATVWIEWDTPEGLNVAVLTESGSEVAGDDTDPGEDEVVSFDVENGKLYEVRVGGFVNVSTAYRGYLWARSTSGRSFSGPGNLVYPRTTAPTNVASSQKKAEAAIADAVAKLTGGRYLAAVTAARAAVTASNTVLRVAVKATR